MTITPPGLKARMALGRDFHLVDVREPDEWEIAHLPGAKLIPLSKFQHQALEELDPDDEIILYCHHGMRSAKAQSYLHAKGYAKVTNLTGGIDGWSREVDPSVKRY